ncbi:MAG: hypothetical protein ACPGYV_00775 [Phycisphaeraceae bacterium]
MLLFNRSKRGEQGYKVWHLGVAIPAIALLLSNALGSLPEIPDDHAHFYPRYATAYGPFEYEHDYPYFVEPGYPMMPEMEILPLHLRGEMSGPLLASVLQEVYPESTVENANDLRDTLPPCDDPRMIVIVPKDEAQPVF